MRLDQISVALRPRIAWEALDVGARLVQHWGLALYRDWLVLAALVFIVLQVVLYPYGSLPLILTWWLKPLWERLVLLDVSRRLFGETLSLRSLLKLSWQVGRRQLLADLLWRRLSPTRSFDMAVAILEQQAGNDRRRRLGVLQRRAGSAAMWLTLVGVHMEALLMLAGYALIYMMLPSHIELDWQAFFSAEMDWAVLLGNVLGFLAMAAVAPFYVASGFSLYISRRTELEGWDIELAFRRLAQRLASWLLPAVLLMTMLPAMVQAVEPNAVSAEQARTTIEQVLAGEDFHQQDVQRVPQFILDWELFDDPKSENGSQLPDWLPALAKSLAEGFEILLWAVVLTALILLLYRYRRELRDWVASPGGRGAAKDVPEQLFGLDLRREQLPVDAPALAASLWKQGQKRAALAALYRSALGALMHRHQLRLRDGFTEGDCLHVARSHLTPELWTYLARLTRAWQRIAYAHQPPSEAELMALCDDWPEGFRGPVS